MWSFYQPVQIKWGEGEVKKLGTYLAQMGYDHCLMIADAFLVRCGLAGQIQQWAEGRIAEISCDVEPNPTIQNVNAGVKKAKALSADCVIALGGGSAMDCAKAVAAAAAENVGAETLLAGMQIHNALPVVAIPTTAGTGSEVTAGAVLSDKDKGLKSAIFSPALFPRLALTDPELTYSVPANVTAATGLDVLAHALDAMSSIKACPATDALALRACKLVVQYLERAVKDGADREARGGMSQASTIAGLAFSQTGTTGSHACSYILTSRYGVPHGEACAFTLDAWVRINAKARLCLNDYAGELGFEDAEDLAAWLRQLKKRLGMRDTLREIGITEKEIEMLSAAAVASNNMTNNVAQIGEEGVAEIFRSKI